MNKILIYKVEVYFEKYGHESEHYEYASTVVYRPGQRVAIHSDSVQGAQPAIVVSCREAYWLKISRLGHLSILGDWEDYCIRMKQPFELVS